MQIQLDHIHKRFGHIHANDDISAHFASGRIVGVLGENGAGKSTLMKILAGYQPADSGTIVIDGQPAAYHGPQAAIAAGVGMLQQDPLDVAAFTVLENFLFGQPKTLTRRAARTRLMALSAQFGFDLDPDLPAARLSIGQRQQLEIVRLLALGVRALILDEPTTGISAQQKERLFAALRRLARDEDMIVLLVSHKLEDVIALCDEVVVLRAGRLVGATSMPTTTAALVRLMFEQALTPPSRGANALGATVFALEAVRVHDRRISVENFSLALRAGEVIGLAGLDGSGQELIMRACVGLIRTDRGHIRLGQQTMTHRPYRDFLHAGVVFSAAGRLEEGLIAGLTLTEHMALARARGAWIDWPRMRDQTEHGIRAYNVRGRPEDRVEMLSGGNQQRWLMALLPAEPQVMILEQPTRGLDVDSARWVWQQLLARRTRGAAIIFSSADLDELVTYSDRLVVFFAGRFHLVPHARDLTVEQIGHWIGGHFEEAQ